MSENTTMSDAQRREFLKGVGLDPDASALVDENAPAKATSKRGVIVVLAPSGVDPHAMPVSEIVFDERLLDDYPELEGAGLKAASDHVFAQYRSRSRDKDRHSLLHRRITEFIGQMRRSRTTGGHVRELVKATKEQRDLAALLAEKGLTVTDLVALLQAAE